jgi:hypothetical protein
MSPSVRARVIDAMVEVLPVPKCHDCRKEGCPDPHWCCQEACEKLLNVIEREGKVKL